MEYLHTSWGSLMKLPFDLPKGHLAVLVPTPKVRKRKRADGTVVYEAHRIRCLRLEADRGLFDIGFMLNVHQFANLSAAERFTILALQRRLDFKDKLHFPDISDKGRLHYVVKSDQKLVWATISETVTMTSLFTALDLHDQCMAISEPEAMRETIERALQGCLNADVEEMLKRFRSFKPPHLTDINRALKNLLALGIVRVYIKVDSHRRRAVFNMRMVAATRSGILRGMIAAEDLICRVKGAEVTFSVDLGTAEVPAKRANSTMAGRRRNITRAQYQSMYHSERDKRIKVEKRIADYEGSGYLTPEQFVGLRHALDDQTLPTDFREMIKQILASALSDPLTEIPEILGMEEKRHA